MPDDNTIMVEDARIIFKNFAGKEGKYNREGDRNFALLLDDELAKVLAADGWNVKYLKPREVEEGEDEHADAYLQVSVGYKGRPPRVVTITSRGRTELGEDEVEVLDYADIQTVDLIVRPYDWGPIRGEMGRKAYLKSFFATIREDELEKKYADVRMAGTSGFRSDEDD